MESATKPTIIRRVKNRIIKCHRNTLLAVNDFIWSNSAEGKENRNKLLELKNKYAGRRCFVMANGPSLNKCDLTVLKNEVTIASNAQFLIWDEMGFAPTFLTVEDQLVAEDRAKELNAIKNTTKIFSRDLSYCLNYDESTIFVNFIRNYKEFPKFSDDFDIKVYWGGTVSFLNLQLAYYIGCKEIYLIGFDHNYKVPDQNKINNFVITSEENDVNHIHPDYFGKGYRWHDPNVTRMEQSYIVSRKFFDERGIQIYNATVGGKLEVFKRKNFNMIFER